MAINVRRAATRFPKTGYASLKDQITRAAESIYHNILEACGASTPREHARYLDISIKSTSELEGQLELARAYGILSPRDWRSLTAQTIDTRRMLCGYRKSVLRSDLSRSRPFRTADNAKREADIAPTGAPNPPKAPESLPEREPQPRESESPSVAETEQPKPRLT